MIDNFSYEQNIFQNKNVILNANVHILYNKWNTRSETEILQVVKPGKTEKGPEENWPKGLLSL